MSEDRVRLDALPTAYPRLFSTGTLPWGFEIGDGWERLVATLCARLDSILAQQAPGATMRVLQVKEKFGALRFYYDLEDADDATRDAIAKAVALAEAASAHLCEGCGHPGRRRNRAGWIATLCDACHERAP